MTQQLTAFMAALLFSCALAAAPGTGEQAPNWTLDGSDGQIHSLADLQGKHVVIAFFPKAYTSG